MEKKRVVFLCRVMEFLLMFGLIVLPMVDQFLIRYLMWDCVPFIYSNMLITEEWYLADIIDLDLLANIVLLKDFIISLMLWQFYKIFKNVRMGNIFSMIQIKCISRCGWLLIAMTVYSSAINLFYGLLHSPEEKIEVSFVLNDLSYIPMGLGIIILAYVIGIAKNIKDEQELVI